MAGYALSRSKYAEKIFTVFRRLHGRSAYEGTGVGLAVCRKIAERHQSTISAGGTLGAGSVFTIELPTSTRELRAAA